MAEFHINVGFVALSRGFITLETFAKGVEKLAHSGRQSVHELWGSHMSDDQLATVLETLGKDGSKAPDTMVVPTNVKPIAPPIALKIPSSPQEISTKVGRKHTPTGPGTAPTAASIVSEPPPPNAVAKPSDKPSDNATQPIPISTSTADLVGGRYRSVSVLGKGGLGEVMACDDTVLQRTVALKAGHVKGDVDSYSSKVILAREARIIASLEHPNIIPIYDAGNDPVRGPYYVMRQVTETSLEAILSQRKKGEGNPHDYTLNRLLRYFLQVCNAVDYAHHRGVIHCDIKPANILLGDYGEVLLVDWGLAQSRNHPLGVRGGTLGYMAPEQMDPSIERLDWRTDVFALGAIIYEILCGVPAFAEARTSDITALTNEPKRIYKTPLAPSVRDPRLEIPREVEDTCMQAIAVERDKRLETVRELANAIEDWIEGSKQKERQRIEADKSADAGDDLAERYHEFVESRPEKLTVFRALRADTASWAVLDEKQDLWDAEDIVKVTDALQVRTFHSAVSAYERALDAVPGHTRARRGLARLYWSELQRARHRGEALDQVAYEQLLREVDDGTFMRELQRDGLLELTFGEHAGKVTLAPLVEQQRRLVEGAVDVIQERPLAHRSLAAGRYVVTTTIGDGPHRVSWPVNIEPGALLKIAVDPPELCRAGDGEVLIPGGHARIGGDLLSSEADEVMTVDVPSFILQRYPVTFGQWFMFLDEVRRRDPDEIARHIPRTAPGMPTWELRNGRWRAETDFPSDKNEADPMRLPVFGVSAESAEAYARWLSEREERVWRLPTEIEWEKAGRGTDGRIYPWGDHFDATFCKMRDSRPGLPIAEPIGTFEWDVSPYGVRDLAGGVADWCIPDPRRTAPREPREVVSRGGAWCDWPIDCRLASRRRYLATEHSARVGVRLARDP
ncbi:MAG TPA: bifunctional serine/threonine-protein kinase/formylglycine-generating enzyme family protein [Kofleriaceae bacterium]|nr:bifunctional serine/threonine-protein kinase/formylglycine-generating enzyme family protein [Kofleriaceae bacterium]